MCRRRAISPFTGEIHYIVACQPSVRLQSSKPCGMKVRNKHAQRSKYEDKKKGRQPHKFEFVVWESCPFMQYAVCNESRYDTTVGHQQRRERGSDGSQESYAAAPVRMQRNQI